MAGDGSTAASWGGLLGGVGALLGAVGGFLGARSTTRRHLATCEDQLADAWSIIGVLLSIAPGGELAERFDLYRRDRDPEIASILTGARARYRQRVERARRAR